MSGGFCIRISIVIRYGGPWLSEVIVGKIWSLLLYALLYNPKKKKVWFLCESTSVHVAVCVTF